MQYPLLIGEPLYNIVPYFSIEHIRCYLESWVVEEQDRVAAYDCEGRLLKLGCEDFHVERETFFGKRESRTLQRIIVNEQESVPRHISDVKESLSCHFEYAYADDSKLIEYFNNAELPVLVNALVNYYRADYKRCSQQVRAMGFYYPLTISVGSAYEKSFNSLQTAESSLSAKIAEDSLYTGYDGAGRSLAIEPHKKGRVIITLTEGIARKRELNSL